MTVNTVSGTNSKPVATAALIASIEAVEDLEGQLMTGFPILGAHAETRSVDALLVSPKYGVVVFDLVEGTSLDGFEDRQDELNRVMQSRLLNHRELVVRKKLIPTISTVTFAPGVHSLAGAQISTDEYLVSDGTDIHAVLSFLPVDPLQRQYYARVLSAIQNISTLGSTRVPRIISDERSRGARLRDLEGSIATLDNLQSKAVIETIDDVQRIRGLAGSGKTIVLALKAAYLHALHPTWKIGVTFNTRSLKDQFKRLITTFTIEQTGQEPDWDQLKILNAWGGRKNDNAGIYSEFCDASGVTYLNFGDASRMFSDAFDGACSMALRQATEVEDVYDAILVDEAQDLPPSFLKMCYLMLGSKKRLVYAYDELQNLSGAGLPSPQEIFGTGPDGLPLVDFDSIPADENAKRDIVLEKCYRNSRPVLVTAHALGFGVYREPPKSQTTGLVQLFQNPSLWGEIGYDLEQGPLRENEHVVLSRRATASPPFLEAHSDISDIIEFRAFDTAEEQNTWVAEEIVKNLALEELRHDDIVVVNPNGITARNNLAPLRADLLQAGVANHLAGVDTSADVFFQREQESVTFTGIFRAKGNEAGMVYVVNAQEGADSVVNLALIRNRLFTAITRSKAWVRVVGVGPEMQKLVDEFEAAKANKFKLSFRYPTDKERETLTLLHREVSPEQEETISRRRMSLRELVEDLEEQRLFPADLDPVIRARLLEILATRADS